MLIDIDIRDHVLLPLLFFTGLYMFLREYLFKLVMSKPDAGDMTGDEVQQRATVARAARLRANGGYITGSGFQMRKDYFVDGENRVLNDAKVKDKMANPMAGMDAMKGQLVGQALHLGSWYAVQNSLVGFLLVKLPFALTERFKQITQAGILVPGLDTSYVSSGSLYMIGLFGLPKVLSLFSSAPSIDETKMMQMQMGMVPGMGGMGAQPGGWMAKNAYKNEAGLLNLAHYSSALVDSEKSLLKLAARS